LERKRVNREIKATHVHLIDDQGKSQGVVPVEIALRRARERNLDLVEVSHNITPPVCKIIDYGKYRYEQLKRQKRAKKKQHVVLLKEIKLRPVTSDHDYLFKMKQVQKFLEQGHKVKVMINFRARESVHMELGEKIIERLKKDVSEVGHLDKETREEGRSIITFFSPIIKKR
jgi:translation initiation factor IF-3